MSDRDTRVLDQGGDPVGFAEVAPDEPVLLVGSKEAFESCGVARRLEERGWPWAHADDADRARWLASIQRIALVVATGEVATVRPVILAVRSATRAPVAVLGAFGSQGVIHVLADGADAVIDPAGDPEEVFARITAVLRRADVGWEPGVRYLRAGDLRVDLWAKQCQVNGRPVRLSPTEYELLVFFMTHPLVVLPIHMIVRRVWGWLPSDGTNALRIVVNRLRRKLDDDPDRSQYIGSIRGTGYRFVRNVREIGDDTEAHEDASGEIARLRSVAALAADLQGAAGAADVAARFLAVLDANGYADAMALFEVAGDRMVLVAERNNTEGWRASVAGGVPLRPTDAAAYSVLTGDVVAVSDIAAATHFSPTAERLAADGYGSCLFMPVLSQGRVWGHLGLARRNRQPFDAGSMVYLRAACAVLGLALTAGQGQG